MNTRFELSDLVSPRSLFDCLIYLSAEARKANMQMAAHLIDVAAESVLQDMPDANDRELYARLTQAEPLGQPVVVATEDPVDTEDDDHYREIRVNPLRSDKA